MKLLSGWSGPVVLTEGISRYSKYISWTRLYIEVEDGKLSGGICGSSRNLEVVEENGCWMLYETDLAKTATGEPVLRLFSYTTWDVVYERISNGKPIKEKMECIEDLAGFLEKIICYEGRQ